MLNSPLLPLLLESPLPASQQGSVQRAVNQSAQQYYRWPTMKNRMVADIFLSNLDSHNASAAVGSSVLTYAVLTTAEKVLGPYRQLLRQLRARHPKLEEFANVHPIVFNTAAWLPGLLFSGLAAASVGFAGYRLTKTSAIQAVLTNKWSRTIGALLAAGTAIGTSFWGLLAKNGWQTLRHRSQSYKALKKEHPDWNAGQIKAQIREDDTRALLRQELLL